MSIYDYEDSKRFSLTLSKQAYDVITSDISRFNYPKRNNQVNLSGFLNEIFEKYYDKVNDIHKEVLATINSVLSQNYAKLDSETIQSLKNGLVKIVYSHSIESVADKGSVTTKFLVNKKNASIINAGTARYNFTSISNYLRSLFESYAKLPIIEREGVFYSDVISKLEDAIKRGKKVRIKLIDGDLFTYRPHGIFKSMTNQVHELVGDVEKEDSFSDGTSAKYSEFRRIKILRIAVVLNTEELFTLNQNINIDTYSKAEKEIFVVQLSEKGVEQLRRQYENRPKYLTQTSEEKNNNIFRFESDIKSMLYYFLKFGHNAKIISPKETVDLFRDVFKYALEQYEDK